MRTSESLRVADELLRLGDAGLRAAAAEGLAAFATPDAVQRLVDVAMSDDDTQVRERASAVLGRLDTNPAAVAAEYIAGRLISSDPLIRRRSYELLARLRNLGLPLRVRAPSPAAKLRLAAQLSVPRADLPFMRRGDLVLRSALIAEFAAVAGTMSYLTAVFGIGAGKQLLASIAIILLAAPAGAHVVALSTPLSAQYYRGAAVVVELLRFVAVYCLLLLPFAVIDADARPLVTWVIATAVAARGVALLLCLQPAASPARLARIWLGALAGIVAGTAALHLPEWGSSTVYGYWALTPALAAAVSAGSVALDTWSTVPAVVGVGQTPRASERRLNLISAGAAVVIVLLAFTAAVRVRPAMAAGEEGARATFAGEPALEAPPGAMLVLTAAQRIKSMEVTDTPVLVFQPTAELRDLAQPRPHGSSILRLVTYTYARETQVAAAVAGVRLLSRPGRYVVAAEDLGLHPADHYPILVAAAVGAEGTGSGGVPIFVGAPPSSRGFPSDGIIAVIEQQFTAGSADALRVALWLAELAVSSFPMPDVTTGRSSNLSSSTRDLLERTAAAAVVRALAYAAAAGITIQDLSTAVWRSPAHVEADAFDIEGLNSYMWAALCNARRSGELGGDPAPACEAAARLRADASPLRQR